MMPVMELLRDTVLDRNVMERMDVTGKAMVLDLVRSGGSWMESRDRLVKKLEVMSIVAALIGAVFMTTVTQTLTPSAYMEYCRTPELLTSMCFHLFYASAVCGAGLCLTCLLRSVVLQAHLLMFTPTEEKYLQFLLLWHFDEIDMFLANGIYCFVLCIPCAVAVVTNLLFGAGVLTLFVYYGKVWVHDVWMEMLGHNLYVMEEEEKQCIIIMKQELEKNRICDSTDDSHSSRRRPSTRSAKRSSQ